jgi:hypothetical protein
VEFGPPRPSPLRRCFVTGYKTSMVLKYRSGEEIKKGDRVLFHGNPATVELVAVAPAIGEEAWYVDEYGGGVMILDPLRSGRTFIDAAQIPECEDLEFVSRVDPG